MNEIVICKYCGKLEFYEEMLWLNGKCECRDCYKSHREELDNKPYKWDDLDGNRPTLEDLFNSFNKEIQEFCKNFNGNEAEIENINSIDCDKETLKLVKFYLLNKRRIEMDKRLALTKDGQLTYCTASDENIGKGRCNHVIHQKSNETKEEFFKRANKEIKRIEILNKTKEEKLKDIENNQNLDVYIKDSKYKIRLAVAERGYGLDKLVNDKNQHVRAIVAQQGYGLDKLINDKECHVREEVAKQGYGLDILINDEDFNVRVAVAECNYKLYKLINDKSFFVRMAVARQGYGFDKLINDEDSTVREIVKLKLDYYNLTLEEWIAKNPNKCALKNNYN